MNNVPKTVTSTVSTLEQVAEVRVTGAAGQRTARSDKNVAGTKTVSPLVIVVAIPPVVV